MAWPTLSASSTNFDFWSHEFEKHRTCWPSVEDTEFFQTALTWRTKIQLATTIEHSVDIGTSISFDEAVRAVSEGMEVFDRYSRRGDCIEYAMPYMAFVCSVKSVRVFALCHGRVTLL